MDASEALTAPSSGDGSGAGSSCELFPRGVAFVCLLHRLRPKKSPVTRLATPVTLPITVPAIVDWSEAVCSWPPPPVGPVAFAVDVALDALAQDAVIVDELGMKMVEKVEAGGAADTGKGY